MSRLSAVLKDKSQQCQNEHAKSHQVFEIIVPHRHHLDSLREFRQCHPRKRLFQNIFYHCKTKTYNEQAVKFAVVCFLFISCFYLTSLP